MSELLRALAAYISRPGPELAPIAAALELPLPEPAAHHELFGLQLYPYASVYLGPEGMLGGEARARVAGFWHAVGATPPAEPDHLAALLGAYSTLAADPAPQADRARRVMLWEHLLSWLPAWLAKLPDVGSAAYVEWGRLLGAALEVEARELGGPAALPAHLREAPLLEPDHLFEHALAPVRTGMLLTRRDLDRAGSELGLGRRRGERALALRSMFDQDPPAVLDWLAGEAAAWGELHDRLPGPWRPVTRWWRHRAVTTRTRLQDLARLARDTGAGPRGGVTVDPGCEPAATVGQPDPG